MVFEIKGEVKDDKYARRIVINDTPEFIELSAPKIPFSKKIKLKKGLNEITIKTADLLGKETEKKIRVVGDFEGPAFNIKNYVDGDNVGTKRVILNGALADATGVTTLKINNQVLAYNKEREVEFAMAVDLKEGNNQILLAATDAAGDAVDLCEPISSGNCLGRTARRAFRRTGDAAPCQLRQRVACICWWQPGVHWLIGRQQGPVH